MRSFELLTDGTANEMENFSGWGEETRLRGISRPDKQVRYVHAAVTCSRAASGSHVSEDESTPE